MNLKPILNPVSVISTLKSMACFDFSDYFVVGLQRCFAAHYNQITDISKEFLNFTTML
jgi:hypothetical protein